MAVSDSAEEVSVDTVEGEAAFSGASVLMRRMECVLLLTITSGEGFVQTMKASDSSMLARNVIIASNESVYMGLRGKG
jgi:hypothetical protein